MNYAAGCPCCRHQPTSGFCAQAVPINDFPSMFVSWRSVPAFLYTEASRVVRGFLSVLLNSPSPEGRRDLGLSKATHAPACPPAHLVAWPRNSLGKHRDLLPQPLEPRPTAQKGGESGTIGFNLFARSLRAHTPCKPHLTLERHLIYAV